MWPFLASLGQCCLLRRSFYCTPLSKLGPYSTNRASATTQTLPCLSSTQACFFFRWLPTAFGTHSLQSFQLSSTELTATNLLQTKLTKYATITEFKSARRQSNGGWPATSPISFRNLHSATFFILSENFRARKARISWRKRRTEHNQNTVKNQFNRLRLSQKSKKTTWMKVRLLLCWVPK
jgi:hypothetical protein